MYVTAFGRVASQAQGDPSARADARTGISSRRREEATNMAEVKPPRPRNVLVAEFPGLSKDDAPSSRDAGGDLKKENSQKRGRRRVRLRRRRRHRRHDRPTRPRRSSRLSNGEGRPAPKRGRDPFAQDLTADSDDEPPRRRRKLPRGKGKAAADVRGNGAFGSGRARRACLILRWSRTARTSGAFP